MGLSLTMSKEMKDTPLPVKKVNREVEVSANEYITLTDTFCPTCGKKFHTKKSKCQDCGQKLKWN